MKIAILDRNQEQLNHLSNEICKYYFLQDDIFVFKFYSHDEFIEYLYQNIDFKFLFIDELSASIITFKIIQELLPDATIIGLTTNKKMVPLNNFEILYKPYQSKKIYETLVFHVKQSSYRPRVIQVHHRGKYQNILLDDIYYFESYYGKVNVYTKDQYFQCVESNIYYYETLLYRHHFLEIHKSTLVNMSKIKSANLDEYLLFNQKILIPSARKKRQAYKNYIEYLQNHCNTPT